MIKLVGEPVLKDGVLINGVLVRQVMAHIPESKRQFIIEYLDSIRGLAIISVTDNFINLE